MYELGHVSCYIDDVACSCEFVGGKKNFHENKHAVAGQSSRRPRQ
jgi:hypothetical protein